ncbi:hypothetical protein H8K20_12450 [Neobittarella massiliensis]|uniref:Uncharacterized protein n=2 Tax=Oscillospiraceae TaxID=216572 RepID=A0A8J6LWJ8_9FIRM|nr:hypothetical protein [Neobittarella massiliensis]MBC3517200.1 hypothetical protein [Neobittarella massiliensis]SCJ34966.1 Uncharacterised protein [uncultured Anaerotruncus sp.]
MDIKQFVKDRDAAFLSLKKSKILAYCKKYGVSAPIDGDIFWAGVHKAILVINSATPEQKSNSKKWLISHGYSVEI